MADYRFPDSCIQLFARAPLPGEVKTRMQPRLTEQQSLSLHRKLVYHCLQQVCNARMAPVQLWVSADHEYWSELGQEFDFELHIQQGITLGQRMAYALEQGLGSRRSVLLMGSDCPFVTASCLAEALTALHGDVPVVLAPALDGGYVLIGLAKFDATVFENIDWGSGQVMQQTMQQIRILGWQSSLLAPQPDIDCFEDLAHLEQTFPQLLP